MSEVSSIYSVDIAIIAVSIHLAPLSLLFIPSGLQYLQLRLFE